MLKQAAQHARLVSSTDRLVTTLFFAVLAHGVVILGIGFSAEPPPPQGRMLEVTLVPGNTETPPDEAEYLANAAQRGGGNTPEHVRPTSANAGTGEVDNPGRPDGNAARDEHLESPDRRPLLAADAAAARRVAAGAEYAEPRPALLARLSIAGAASANPLDSAATRAQAQSRNPREKFIAVNTREAIWAPYMEAWRRKVERLGNLNYPDEARRADLSGTVRLEVALNADGSIRDLRVRVPSRHKILDQAAQRIVTLGAPYAPFPPEVREQTNVLRFVYDWRFSEGRPAGARVGLGH